MKTLTSNSTDKFDLYYNQVYPRIIN